MALTEPAEQAQGSGDARSHPAELFATVRNLRLDGWEREVALKRIEEQLEAARKERSDAVEVAARAMDRSQSLQEQLEFWQREAARHCDHARSAQEQLEVLRSAAESSSDMEAHS